MSLDLQQIQGIVASGYPHSPAARYVLLGVTQADSARASLGGLAEQIAFSDRDAGKESDDARRLNIAFTAGGLDALGVPADEMTGFSREFREGMVTPHRQRILGDLEGSPSDPLRWLWGGPNNLRVHCALLLFESNETALTTFVGSVVGQLAGFQVVRELRTVQLEGFREHFGFRDGIANPWVEGMHKPRPANDLVAAGEILLGHPDLTGTPEVHAPLGRDGSYLVLRQLAQDVEGFWSALRSVVGDADAVRWAAKMMGRWPDGTPLARSPDGPTGDPTDEFGYADDADGVRCPLGAHVRRSNPRDGLGKSAVVSVKTVNRHRLLRRGRAFGTAAADEAWPPGISPVEVVEGCDDDSGQRGIVFACLGASLARQFEFVAQTWANDPKFAGLYNENDPIIGPPLPGATGCPFTAPGPVINHRIELPTSYVHCIGGAYFFVPGRDALARIVADPDAVS